jgi:hypothetical protein
VVTSFSDASNLRACSAFCVSAGAILLHVIAFVRVVCRDLSLQALQALSERQSGFLMLRLKSGEGLLQRRNL